MVDWHGGELSKKGDSKRDRGKTESWGDFRIKWYRSREMNRYLCS